MTMIRTFDELSRLATFEERYEYLKLSATVGEDTFGSHRYLNQIFYKSPEWLAIRRGIIIRDNGNDLGCSDFPIQGIIMIHHMNVITVDDVLNHNPIVWDPTYLISTSMYTHRAIHFGDVPPLSSIPLERSRNDTTLWK